MLTRRMLGALCWAVAVGGCGTPELPPVVASAPGITIRSSVPMDESTASLSIGYYRTLSDLLGVDQAIEVVRVDDLDAWCRDGVDGCEYGSRAYTVLDFHPHEITHAVFASAGRSLPFLEEGVAELGECALGMPAYVTPTSLPLTESLVFRDSFSGVVGDERTTATQFVSYAVSELGWRGFLALYDSVSLQQGDDQNAQRIAAAMGRPWSQVLSDFEAVGRLSMSEVCAAHAQSLGVGMLADGEVRCLPLFTGDIVFGVRGASESASPRLVRAEMSSPARLYTRFVQMAAPFDQTIWDLGVGGRTLALATLGAGAIESEIWTETEASGEGVWVSVEAVPTCPSAAEDLADFDRIGLAVIGDVDAASVVVHSAAGARLVPSGGENAELAICTDCDFSEGCLSAVGGYQLVAGVTYHVELRRAEPMLPSATTTLGVLR